MSTTFQGILLPDEDSMGWCIPCENNGWLTRNGKIEMVGKHTPLDIFYYEDESEAHSYAESYYRTNGLKYPYYGEWAMAVKRMTAEAIPAVTADEQSQVMDFV